MYLVIIVEIINFFLFKVIISYVKFFYVRLERVIIVVFIVED